MMVTSETRRNVYAEELSLPSIYYGMGRQCVADYMMATSVMRRNIYAEELSFPSIYYGVGRQCVGDST